MRRAKCVGLILATGLLGCSQEPGLESTTSMWTPDLTTIITETTSVTVDTVLEPCQDPQYSVTFLPEGVRGSEAVALDEVEVDEYTSIAGTSVRIWARDDGQIGVALVRGSLPPGQFEGDVGEVSVDGTPGVAGQMPDGHWVVAWVEEPQERCDVYFLVLKQPVEASEVRATLESVKRIGRGSD